MTDSNLAEKKRPDIIIERYNASFIRLYIDDEGVRKTVYDFFTYIEPTFKKNRYTKWDGTTRMLKLSTGLLPYGCLSVLLNFCKERKISYKIDPRFKLDITVVTKSDLVEWVNTLNLHSEGIKIEPYDYQIEALYLSIKFGRMVLLASTSAGKSLVIYMLARYYEMLNGEQDKTLIVVPSQMLVDQLYQDFADYSSENGWRADKNVHTIMQDRAKFSSRPIYISTWQSIYEENIDYFSNFKNVIVDEVHLASGASITAIMDNCINAYRRVGMTGTLKSDKLHIMKIMGLFGPIQRVVSTRQLIDAGRATAVDINSFILKYPEEERKENVGRDYKKEIEFLIRNPYRNKIIASLIATLKGNTLAVFDRLEHIETIERLLAGINHGKKVYVITGDVKRDERAAIKAVASAEDGVIVLGTFGCVSTGLSIKRLRNLVFPHPSKSIVRVLQSLGRILRLHIEKNSAFLFDFMDDLSWEDDPNHTLKHGFERVEMYKHDKLPITFKNLTVK